MTEWLLLLYSTFIPRTLAELKKCDWRWFSRFILICVYNVFLCVYLVKYHYIHDNSNVHYTYEYSLARNCEQNIKILVILHCTLNNLKIHEP